MVVKVAAITAAHGIKGQVVLHSLTSPADTLYNLPELTDAKGNRYKLKITGTKKNRFIASIEGVNDRNAAELLKGTALYANVDHEALPEQSRWPGLAVQLANGTAYGHITDIYNFGAGDVVEIEKTDGSSEMLPLSDDFIRIENKKAVVTPPEYLEAKEE